MIGLTNHIKVTVIRNAAGISTAPVNAGCKPKAATYPLNTNLKTPSGCGSNTQGLYDPDSQYKTVRHIMNFFGAPATDYVPYDRADLETELPLGCTLKHGDHLVVVWVPLTKLNKELLVKNLSLRRV
jgi:hypothetical protein